MIGATNSKLSVYGDKASSFKSSSSPTGSVLIPDNSPEAAILVAHPEVVLPQPADFESNSNDLSKEAISIISSFLDVNFITRLGSGQYGTYNVKADKYFEDIDWKRMDCKQCEPPVDSQRLPTSSVVNRLSNLVTGNNGNNGNNSNNSQSQPPLGRSVSVGSTWIKRLRDYAKTDVDSVTHPHTNANNTNSNSIENTFNFNFEKLLISIGKEHWIMTPLQLLNSSVSWGNNFSVQERKEFFSDWDYSNVDCMLKEVGLTPTFTV